MQHENVCTNANVISDDKSTVWITGLDLKGSENDLSLHFPITLIALWMLTVILSTAFGRKGHLLSLKNAWSDLTTPHRSKLNCINYYRVVAILWVMVNHLGSEGRIDILERLPSSKEFKHNVHTHLIFGPLFGNSSLGVEIFLVLSGILAARSWVRAENERAGKSFPRQLVSFLIKRVLRLFPSVAFFVWFAQGSITKYYLPRFWNTMISSCGWKGLASHLTFTNNWQSSPTCLGYLWYLGLDMQMYAVAPILLYVLTTKQKLGASVLLVLVAISSGLRAVWCRRYSICNQSDVDIPFISYPNQTEAELKEIYEGLWDIYSRPCTKSGPFFIGLLTGYLSTVSTIAIPAFLKTALNKMSIAGCLFCVFGILPEYWNPEAGSTTYNTLYTAIFRSLFAACISWQILYLVKWRSCPDSNFISILAKLTFQAYLLHMPMVYLFNYSIFLQTAEGPWPVLFLLPFLALISYTAAFVLFMFIESPIARVTSKFHSWLVKMIDSKSLTRRKID
ncbi:hypothetical protein QR680_015967 [Steinernema hermaphroditum]|uniref:Acyltransferase 3 domain-containing protein n=1 Tax=Steinernema hermaphroditum TaxID=289476 RepID=A0AA39LLS9_9BILA|nr:hypothetical protein QR680_015967 [Steinernema hermaphroditum]